jgi:hypothetical protein
MSENGTHPTIGGFVPRPRTKQIVCALLDPADGAEPLTATIRTDVVYAHIDAINELRREPTTTMADLWPMLAPFVVGWNAVALDLATGEYAPVPPPAEAGADAFRSVDSLVTIWLAAELGRVHLGDDRPKGSTPPASTASGSGGSSSEATAPNPTPARKNRRSSSKPSAAT